MSRQRHRAGPLVARTDAVKNVQRHIWDRMIFLNENLQPVLERVCFHVKLLRSNVSANKNAEEQDRQSNGTFHGDLPKALPFSLCDL
jgi:hypothetical protein